MNKIKNAIIMASGLGNRLQPITDTIPKPLVKVQGVRMIDTIINALHKNGITEIYVVVGYLKDQFYDWVKSYEGITLIENPYYNIANNIGSLFMARNFIGDSLILDGDQIIYNPEILNPNYTLSGYSTVYNPDFTTEWLLNVDQDLKVTSCNKTGGKDSHQLFSISRWTQEDGKKLATYLEEEFMVKHNTQIFWDDVPLFCHFEKFNLTIYPIQKGDCLEIDTFEELTQIDSSYK